MTFQRRRGEPVTLYPVHTVLDDRGNEVIQANFAAPINTTAAAIPQRSSRAEVPGQQVIYIVRLIIRVYPNVELWSQVDFRGERWDVVSPPAYHHGTRLTRHVSIDIKRRP